MDVGIAGVGAYVPSMRVNRAEIAAANAWLKPGQKSKSDRSFCSWDEDSITMSVEAARDCLIDVDRTRIGSLFIASTTAPFADRLNASVIASALRLEDSVFAQDVSGSLRAGMTALLSGVDTVQARGSMALCLAADSQATLAGSAEEITTGHAAAAVLLSPGPGLARLIGSASLTVDFVDHFRALRSRFDYHWEERWVRDEGYLKLVPRLVQTLLQKVNLSPKDVTYFCVPCPVPGLDRLIAKKAGLPDATLGDQIADGCGNSGAAHSVLMLVRTMQDAHPGDKILVTAFGQGGEAALFEVTDGIEAYRRRSNRVTKWLGRGITSGYTRYLALSGLLTVDHGIRAEVDKGTALSAAYRHSDLTLGLVGGSCERCGTRQIPRTRVCVNPDCNARNSQLPYSFAETRGRVASWSADKLTYSPDPPAFYGVIDFDGGGRLLMDFTNVESGRIQIGMPMRMVFRIKDRDAIRDFVRYFWKAAPIEPEEAVP